MIGVFWNECMSCKVKCCQTKGVEHHTPVFEADIVDLEKKGLIEDRSRTWIKTVGGLEMIYWPAGIGMWGKLVVGPSPLGSPDCTCCNAYDGCGCKQYEKWRPVYCHLFPFLPVWKIDVEEFVPIIHRNCPPMTARLDRLTEHDRERLRKEIRAHWRTVEEYRLVAAMVYATEFVLKKEV